MYVQNNCMGWHIYTAVSKVIAKMKVRSQVSYDVNDYWLYITYHILRSIYRYRRKLLLHPYMYECLYACGYVDHAHIASYMWW